MPADRLRLVVLAAQAEPTADLVAAGVAGCRALGQRLQCGIDRQVDRQAHLDRGTVEHDPVRRGAAGRRGVGRRAVGLGVGVQAVQRARRLAQRLERLQHGVQRGRHHPARVVERIGQARFAGQGRRRGHGHRAGSARRIRHPGHPGRPGHREPVAQPPLHAARAGDKVARQPSLIAARVAAEIDAAGDAVPGVAPRHMVGRYLRHLIGTPARQHCAALGATPGQGIEHARVGMQQGGQCGSQVAAADLKALARVVGGFDRRAQAFVGQREPARRIEADRLADARVAAVAEAQQRGVQLGQAGGNPLGLRRQRRADAGHARQPIAGAPGRAPFAAALRQAIEHLLRRRWRWRERCCERCSFDDRRLEGFQRRDMAHAQVAVGGAAPRRRAGIGRPRQSDQQHDAEHDRHDGQAGGDREIEQGRGAPFRHRWPLWKRLREG